MPEGRFYESIFSLTTTPERAASIVGDLIEEGAGPGRMWAAIGSNLLHSFNVRMLGAAFAGFIVQFVLTLVAALALTPVYRRYSMSFLLLRWSIGLAFLAMQSLTGYLIGKVGGIRAVPVSTIIVLMDYVLGALNVNNGSINIAIWSVPLLAATILQRHGSVRRGRILGA